MWCESVSKWYAGNIEHFIPELKQKQRFSEFNPFHVNNGVNAQPHKKIVNNLMCVF